MTWIDKNGAYQNDPTKIAAVLLRGTYFINGGGNLNLDWQSIRTAFGTPATAPTPVVMVMGSLIVESGSLTAHSSLTVVGETMDPFNPLGAYPSTTVPGLLAVGGGISANDYDSDSSWTSTGQYEGLKRNATVVRGLVYSGTWNATTNSSVPGDQHWHNYDVKNSTTIIGAQIGGKLHDCNSFYFSYDPLVANLAGFTGGGGNIYVVTWKEL